MATTPILWAISGDEVSKACSISVSHREVREESGIDEYERMARQ